jgi:DNA polymerase-3 subunit alpha
LEALARNGLQYRYSRLTDEISERLARELDLIRQKDFVTYFLISWDIVRYARQRGYFYVGRGSGANSLVAYCLGITDVDPIELDLYFERFINLYRDSPPDFDMDFSWKDREDVTRYIFEKHGMEHTALLGAYNTFQFRATIRELGKVFGLPKEDIDALVSRAETPASADEIGQLILKYSAYIQGFPNYISIHAGGILISAQSIYNYSATFMPPKGFPTVFFDMHIAEDIGLYKFDILSQRGLGHIRDAVEYVRENQGIDVDIHDIPRFKRDKKIKQLMETGHTMGCFYVESPAMRQLLRKSGCTDYISLVAASSIIRPGVARSGMMQEFIKRYRFPEARTKAHPVLLEILPETFGVMVYQEDVIKVAHYFAGLSLAEADVLRRGMSGKSRSKEEFQRVREAFFANCAEKGYSEALAQEVWFQIESFAGYSFSKAHSASYAVESFQSLYLKAHYPLEFMCAVINNFGGFYKTEFYVHGARMSGAEVLTPCVNHSDALCCITGKRIFIGLAFIESLEQTFVWQLLQERQQHGVFQDMEDFVARMQPSLTQLKTLVKAGAFTFTGVSKKELLWRAHLQVDASVAEGTVEQGVLFKTTTAPFALPDFSTDILEDAYDQMALLGFTMVPPFLLCDAVLQPHILAADLSRYSGKEVRVYGYLVTIKPTRTVKGDRMCFGTFIDEKGHWIDTTHFPKIAAAYPFRGRGIYEIVGTVDEAYGVYAINVSFMQRLPDKPDPRGDT